MKKIYFFLIAIICTITTQFSYGQLVINSGGTSVSENFDGMGTSATATIPSGFKIGTDWSTGNSATTISAGTTGTGVLTGTSSGGVYNFGNGVNSTATDRALGFLNTGSFTSPRSIVLRVTNNTGNTITALDITFDYEKYRSGSRAFDWTFFHGNTSNPTTAAITGNQSYAADANNTVINNPPTTISKTVNLNGLSIPNGGDYYLKWTYTGVGGSTNGQASGIDNFTITATTASSSNTVSVSSGSNASEPATNGSFTINFSTPTSAPTDIDFSFGGAATFGTDYTVSYSAGTTPSTTSSGTLTVPSGTSSVTVTLTPIDDALVEPTEDIILSISNPQGGYTLGSPSTSSINLTDNDVAPSASVAAGINAAEPSTNGTFTITLTAPAPAGGVNVTYTLSGTATQNSDYTDPQAGTVLVAAGTTTATVTLNVTDDSAVEPAETIILTLTGADNGYTASGNATINIADNDVAPLIPISLTGGVYSQDFNSLSNTGTTNNLTLAGWSLNETGGGARDNEQYAGDNGGSNTGDTYSYGTVATTERALGSLRSGTLISSYGAYFKNNTGNNIHSLKIIYTGEEWRLGTRDRYDQLDFQYSTDATSLTSGTWVDIDALDFITPDTSGTGAKDGNDPLNSKLISFTINGLSIPTGATFFIRWNDADASGADDGLSVDDFSIEPNPVDLDAPVISSLNPPNGATGIPINTSVTITFSEAIQKGTGNILLRQTSDNSLVQSFDVASSAVSVYGNSASFNYSGLLPGTGYYFEIPNTAFEDFAGNDFAGFSGNGTWAFTTGTVFYTADFQNCSSSLSDGFTQFSVTGALTWACTTFGRDASDATGNASSPYGVQMNGFSGGTNVPNVDWLISPSLDLTGTTYPLLSFWSRTAFNGAPLELKISTDYVSGDPSTATWTDINGKFPEQTTNLWKLSNNINLSAFKQSNVHFAFVYTSTNDEGARWTIDDVSIDNSATPPPPSITTSTNDIQYTFVASGSTANKTFTFTGNDITSDVTLTATSGFLLSKDGSTFSPSITYTLAEANNLTKTVTVQFAPTQPSHNYTGTVTLSTSNLSSAINLKGTSIDPVNTLEVVNWNMEWFGHPSLGPANDNQQQANAQLILQNIGADIFGLVEVVDESRLAAIVSNMPGYSYVIGNYGSHVNPPDPSGGPVSDAQKEAFVYKTSMFSNISVRPMINNQDVNSTSYNNWASGRYPFLMTADVVLNGVTKTINFVLIHAKANTSPTNVSYTRREAAANELHDTLIGPDFANANVIVLGDFNDDLDQSITAGFTTTSYHAFTTDNANFFSPTLALSLAGKKSTVSFNDVIDHVMLSNEMQQYYMGSTASILTDVSSLVTNYGSTTTDHYPVFTRFAFDGSILPVKLITFDAAKDGSRVKLTWSTSGEVNADHFTIERSSDGRNFVSIGNVNASGTTNSLVNYQLADAQPFRGNNYYRLKMVDADRHTEYSRILKIDFSKSYTLSFSPNPAKTDIVITVTNNRQALKLDIIDMNGKVVKTQIISPQNSKVSISTLSKGMYILKVEGEKEVYTEKLIIE